MLNYSTDSFHRGSAAAEGVETFVSWAVSSLRRTASQAHQPMVAIRRSMKRRPKKKETPDPELQADSGAGGGAVGGAGEQQATNGTWKLSINDSS